MRITYAPLALRDIDEILGYVQKRSPSGARNLSTAIEHTIERCALTLTLEAGLLCLTSTGGR